MATKEKSVPAVQSGGTIGFSQEAPEWAKSGTARGSENVGSKDLVLPRLEIVQAQSPIKDTNPDAKEGMLFNSATGDLIGEEAYIVPIFYRMEYLVWKDQDEGGGFFGAYDTEREAQARVEEEVSNGENPEHLEVIDTPVHYCLRIRTSDGSTEQIVVSMAKSKAKVSRKWNAVIHIAGGDRFSRAYKFTTFKDKNKQNKTFFNYIVQPAGFPPEKIFREAERLYEVFKTQGVRADHAAAAGADGGDSGHEGDAI
jgi:hypothetical protein